MEATPQPLPDPAASGGTVHSQSFPDKLLAFYYPTAASYWLELKEYKLVAFSAQGGFRKSWVRPSLTDVSWASRNKGHRGEKMSKLPITVAKTTELCLPNTFRIFPIKFLLSIFSSLYFYTLICIVCAHESWGSYEVKGQLVGVGPLLRPCGFQGLNPSHSGLMASAFI